MLQGLPGEPGSTTWSPTAARGPPGLPGARLPLATRQGSLLSAPCPSTPTAGAGRGLSPSTQGLPEQGFCCWRQWNPFFKFTEKSQTQSSHKSGRLSISTPLPQGTGGKILPNSANREGGSFQLRGLLGACCATAARAPGRGSEEDRSPEGPESQGRASVAHKPRRGLTERGPCSSASPRLSCVSPGIPSLPHPAVKAPETRVGQRPAEGEAQEKGRGQSIARTSTYPRHQRQL